MWRGQRAVTGTRDPSPHSLGVRVPAGRPRGRGRQCLEAAPGSKWALPTPSPGQDGRSACKGATVIQDGHRLGRGLGRTGLWEPGGHAPSSMPPHLPGSPQSPLGLGDAVGAKPQAGLSEQAGRPQAWARWPGLPHGAAPGQPAVLPPARVGPSLQPRPRPSSACSPWGPGGLRKAVSHRACSREPSPCTADPTCVVSRGCCHPQPHRHFQATDLFPTVLEVRNLTCLTGKLGSGLWRPHCSQRCSRLSKRLLVFAASGGFCPAGLGPLPPPELSR